MSDEHLVDFRRAGSVTASVVAAILRCDANGRSRKWAWRVITGREPERESWDMARGQEHEPDAIFGFECEYGVFCLPGEYVPHPLYAWLGASPDAIVPVEPRIRIPVECKCPRELHKYIPDGYYAQLQTQMQCLRAPYGFFVSWCEGEVWCKKVLRNDAWWTENFPVIKEFYELYVKPDVEPPKSPRRVKDAVESKKSNQGKKRNVQGRSGKREDEHDGNRGDS